MDIAIKVAQFPLWRATLSFISFFFVRSQLNFKLFLKTAVFLIKITKDKKSSAVKYTVTN